jgi:hypothetical protein
VIEIPNFETAIAVLPAPGFLIARFWNFVKEAIF